MTYNNQKNYFDDVEAIITQPLSFKAKLAIGEDAYASLRLKNTAFEAWDTAGVAVTAVGVAKSAIVASTFFAPTGILATIGIGATAVTPIGWVIAAGVLTSGAWVGITRYTKGASASRVTVIPNFINTPMDVLALGLFDLIAPLALKIAVIDEQIDESERSHINTYFVKEWGYDQTFVNGGLSFISSRLADYSIKELAQTLAEFKKENPDCNYEPMSKEILKLLHDIMLVDGRIDEREEMAIETVRTIFKEANKISISKTIDSIKGRWTSAKDAVANIISDGIPPVRD